MKTIVCGFGGPVLVNNLPLPKIKKRVLNEAQYQRMMRAGLNPIIARIIATRPMPEFSQIDEWLTPKLSSLDNPNLMMDMDKAVERVARAIINKEVIGLETDHDCDGQTSHALLHCALIDHFNHPPECLQSYIGHRLNEGYGLSESVMNRILIDAPRPTLVITADNGSSDEAQIFKLKAQNIDVIVTDHHAIPCEGIPKSAYAVLNPTRTDCQYPDSMIAGCMVAWLLMAAVRKHLIQIGHLPKTAPCVSNLLDYVAVGTIADCVSIARSRNNRVVVNYGLKLMNQFSRPCWQAIVGEIVSKGTTIRSSDLGFKIGPLLNSDGRLACAFGSVTFLLASTLAEAKNWVEHLQAQNTQRKLVQKRITDMATLEALKQMSAGRKTLCVLLEEGHAGVHGISASRIKDVFGRPALIFCPKSNEPELITGSARSIDHFHLRDSLQAVADLYPGLIVKFGGHKGAAGVTIKRENFTLFSDAFEAVSENALLKLELGPVIWSDGLFPIEGYSIDFIEQLNEQLEPFGREFEPPVFEAQAQVLAISYIGETKLHAKLTLRIDDLFLKAIWFNARATQECDLPIELKSTAHIIFEPKINEFRGTKTIDLQILQGWAV